MWFAILGSFRKIFPLLLVALLNRLEAVFVFFPPQILRLYMLTLGVFRLVFLCYWPQAYLSVLPALISIWVGVSRIRDYWHFQASLSTPNGTRNITMLVFRMLDNATPSSRRRVRRLLTVATE